MTLKAFCIAILTFLIGLAVIAGTLLLPVLGIGLLLLCIPKATRKWAATRAYHIWISYDKYCNALRFHDHRETISSCLGKSRFHGHPPVFNWLFLDVIVGEMLDVVDPDHCRKSIDWEVGRPESWCRNNT